MATMTRAMPATAPTLLLLTEWAHQMGLPGGPKHVALEQVHRFVFGENYMIQMTDGRTYEDKNLEVVLDIMECEFHVFNTTLLLQNADLRKAGLYPMIELLSVGKSVIPSKSDPLGQRGGLSLVVSVVKGWKGAIPAPELPAVVKMVRESVTMFSLTGEWNTYRKDNL